ncbi:dihydrolipoyl dehydrogenase [Rhodospirillum rubrum]|uniref:Dihydrolipoyl dehydrogenase n=1 Tax=Rhodospirillum rubrum (strain ATCC 11170 / ATH 1.1.1 / DSM 467 / LMG 4362 / NCIMB 8255 / S1) TaxID=269796 RepID=Q2RT67_RHORT|nr:dihydrolipoyl dehydrogenase [Rhodospirillum rubrum]ABC22678.1 dihydrolipoamide dehydrogenase [Rhodospirillum rubrum ATCC 11170]AEO48396.1 dihydrolipoamide dehydrogenase [Rhodospirillum rubrum F11]MBK5954276.1 dihydrolipoyl dehydrogenase [Rhodospirillum rubrum]QXG82298.1 dihydrolipoyl dehydrogenase [Rhodospirillum rubrum]HAP99013.1 dihydrolipoyl dehydrogenase [Rhodospirillum rubrum]
MTETSFDVVVLGAGPGGYVAAIRAAQLGLKTAVVEREHLGGICLNWGCIPTKALLRSAEVFRQIRHAGAYGLKVTGAEVDVAAVVKRSRGVAKQLAGGVGHLLKKNKVTVIDGHGRLAGAGKLTVEKDGKTTTLAAKAIILATGGRARTLPGLEADGKLVWTYKNAMIPESLPKRLLVVGSGAIGIEFASFYTDCGSQVTVVEVLERVLPVEDEEISAFAKKSFEKQGMTIKTATTVKALKKSGDEVTATLEKDGKTEEITVDRVIMAVGIAANIEDIGLETVPSIKVERGHVVTDAFCRTGDPGIFAIGDLTAPPWLAHKASHEGVLVAEVIAGKKDLHPLDTMKIPGCTYCHPQVASIGLSEAKAKAKGFTVKVGRFPFVGNGKAIALGEAEGLIKTVFDARTGELLGAHMIGAEVTELIQGFAIAKTLETTEEDLIHTVFAHPTLSEMVHESVLDAYGRAIHF